MVVSQVFSFLLFKMKKTCERTEIWRETEEVPVKRRAIVQINGGNH